MAYAMASKAIVPRGLVGSNPTPGTERVYAGGVTSWEWLLLVAVVVAALAGEQRFRRAAFPAILLLTVLDVTLLLIGGATVA